MGALKMHDLKMTDKNYGIWKMQDWKMTDKLLANCENNYWVWKMQEWKMTDKFFLANCEHNYMHEYSHLQLSVFRTSGATAALRIIITNYCWHIAYKECCNLVDRKRSRVRA